LALQPTGPVHLPAAQMSPLVQPLKSLQPTVLLMKTQPVTALQLSVVQVLPSLQTNWAPAIQLPPLQASTPVHTLPSLHAAVLLLCLQPLAGLQLSSVQALPSSQLMTAPGLHTPAAQMSPSVHKLLSLQGLVFFTLLQPADLSQLSSVQGFPSSQLALAPGTHAPPPQTSPTVQTLPSSQGAVLLVEVQAPLTGSQFSVVQGFLSSQALGPLGVHTPALQVSPTVQLLLSSQTLALLAWLQPADGSQLSSVHGLPSLQLTGPPAAQTPPAQTSPRVQTLPSSQGKVLLATMQPFLLSQLSVVHNLPSSQFWAAPGTHAPSAQASLTVHTLPSVQPTVLLTKLQPSMASQPSSVQLLPSLQGVLPKPLQLPLAHLSPLVQALPSEHCTALLL